MRILIAHSFYRIPGGEDRYVRQQVELLAGDHDADLLATHNEELTGGLTTARRMIGSRKLRADVARRIGDFKPDLIHLHNAYPSLGPAVHLAAKSARIPLVMTVHNYRLRCPNGLMFTEGEPCARCVDGNHLNAIRHHCFPTGSQAAAYAGALWVHRFVLRLERHVDMFITPSEHVHGMVASWGIPEEKLVTVRNFTDPPETQMNQSKGYGLYLGRLSSEKGLNVLLRALKKAGDPPFKIAGDGLLEDNLRKEATRIQLESTEFIGRVDHDRVSELLSGARYMALPSLWDENAPLAALEAMAAGVPLLVTDKGGLPELANGGAGIVCRAGDDEALARGIRTLVSSDSAVEKMGSGGRRYARQNLTPEAHKVALESAYQALLSRSRR